MSLHYSTPLEFKAPEAGGEFVGHLAVFNSIDMSGDSILPHAFRSTLAETKARGVPLPLLWSHDASIVLGKFTELREDTKGLLVRGKLTLETRSAKEAYALLLDRAITGLSIGYTVPDGGAERRGDVRLLKQIDLHEGSLVAVPMHPDCRVVSVKSLTDPRELGRALREGRPLQFDALSRRKAAAAAAAWWSIMTDDDDERDDEQTEAKLTAFADSIKSFNRIFERT